MNATKELFYWYRTHSALHPADFCFYINFQYIGMSREAEPREIDKFRLVEIGKMSRLEFRERMGI